MSQRKNILMQMFDVKPVDHSGDVDFGKIKAIKKVVSLKIEQTSDEKNRKARKFSWKKSIVIYPAEKNPTVDRRRIQNSRVFIKPKARAIQFNRYAFKKEHEIPHLVRSNYVPNAAMVPCADVVRNGELPERKFGSVKIKSSLKSVLDQRSEPRISISEMIKKEKEEITGRKHFSRDDLDKKFSQFFSDEFFEDEPAEKISEEIEDSKDELAGNGGDANEVFEMDLSDFFSNAKDGDGNKSANIFRESGVDERDKKAIRESFSSFNSNQLHTQPTVLAPINAKRRRVGFLKLLFSNYKNKSGQKNVIRPVIKFGFLALAVFVLLGASTIVFSGLQLKGDVEVGGKKVLNYLAQAQEDLRNQNYISASANFKGAQSILEDTREKLDSLGGDALDIFKNLPYLSRLSSGKNVVAAGEDLSKAAQELSKIASIFSELENPLSQNDDSSSRSMTELFIETQGHIQRSKVSIESANESMQKVRIEDLPEEYQGKFQVIKESLPIIISLVDRFEQNSQVYLELLGNNGPRKYMFLFQNNSEMRATGGFIGSYGLLSISDGNIKNLLIDGIFNPDGQLRKNIVPPKPIQKISAGWSTHDANWFPNFPTSANKIAWFYEKTGGPTVDGIITLTPVVLQKMLNVTGPITMEEYEVTIDEDNFIAKTQYEVEIDYDKELNQPKKFIADLAPEILSKLFSQKDSQKIAQVVSILAEALKERHILLYSFDSDVQELFSKQGWSGEVLQTEKDYLMIVNSNINGFKTDGVIDERVEHHAEIRQDGSIIDTVKITRVHNGGDSQYEWWNKVNSNYMRVYVPKGSQLISAKGHTREVIEAPLDYEKLHFEVHSDVQQQEQGMQIDEETGTTIYEENNKTVFANWVYVSPKETVTVEYSYLLPFKVDLSKNSQGVDTYSLLAQKQSGSVGSEFSSIVNFVSDKLAPVWIHPDNMSKEDGKLTADKKLSADVFVGVVFQDKNKKEE